MTVRRSRVRDLAERVASKILSLFKRQIQEVDTLLQDWDRMVTFYSFLQKHWRHLRTTNIVESH